MKTLSCLAFAGVAATMAWAGGPKNETARFALEKEGRALSVVYDGETLLEASFPVAPTLSERVTNDAFEGRDPAWTQRVTLTFPAATTFTATVRGSDQAIAAETRGKAQERLPLIRTAHGPSTNLRNNAIYERRSDWMLEFPEGTRLEPVRQADGSFRFTATLAEKDTLTLTFRPRYYQKHKGLRYYEPWAYDVRRDSVTGWCSWWAYMRGCKEADVDRLLAVWERERFADYGYRFIQLDGVYQGEHDRGREHVRACYGYQGGEPATWLDWRKDLFPGGLDHFVAPRARPASTPRCG